MMVALVDAASQTRLARFYPYTSHAVLRFAEVADHWRYRRPEPPVSIGVWAAPDEYAVWWGQLLSDLERETLILQSDDPHEVVRLAERLLDTWPYAYPIRHRRADPRFWVE
jgi:hypothetical protein